MRVLIVDDEAGMRSLVASLLAQAPDVDVWEAADAASAVARAAEVQPDVILLDVAMPGRSGATALPDLRRAAPGARVAFHTANTDAVVHISVHPSGPDATIEKGMPVAEILEVLRALHASSHI